MDTTRLGIAFPAHLPVERARPFVEAVVEAGLDELWFAEDSFKAGGVAAVASALAWSAGSDLQVGAGLLPVPLRNVAATAMEAAALARLHPDRLLLCVGHGVQPWMAAAGAAVESPLTLLREHVAALRALLAGEEVSVEGRYVRLDGVRLEHPPARPLLVLVGGAGPRTLRLAATEGDGAVLALGAALDDLLGSVRRVHEAAGAPHPVRVPVLSALGEGADDRLAAELADYFMPTDAGIGVAGLDRLTAVARRLAGAGVAGVVVQPTAHEPDLEGFVRVVARDVRGALVAD